LRQAEHIPDFVIGKHEIYCILSLCRNQSK